MDLSKNRIPEKVKKIHLVAVCGTGMGALACILKDSGYEVSGSDLKVYPPMSHFLARKGVLIADGFNGENVPPETDLVVVGNAVTKDNPEVIQAEKAGLSYCSMPQAVNRFMVSGRKPIVIAGTHGKTTTSSILAWILYCAGLDPSYIIGGILNDFSSNYRLGRGDYVVIEGDEYDTAFFDKGAKFLHYDPFMAVLTSVEFDHADIFRDMDHVKRTFETFLLKLSAGSTLFAFDADGNVSSLVENKSCRVERYGKSGGSAWRMIGVSVEPPWTRFEVLKAGRTFGSFKTRLFGEHNLFNTVAAVAVAHSLGVAGDAISRGLETFSGVKRRQEVRGRKNGVTIIDDFAHHPTAVRETVLAVKSFHPDKRLIAVFEPRTNSSMRSVFQDVYPQSFDAADLICIRKPPLLDKIPLSERFSSQKLAGDLKKRGKDAHYFEDTDSIINFIRNTSRPGDTVLVMSNGGFDNIHERLLELL